MKTILILVLVILSFSLFGQEWAPVGAEWYYDKTYAWSGDIDYHRVYCDSIVEFKGIDCKKINIDHCACNNYLCDKLYTFERNDTVFFYNTDIDSFQIMFDFNAKKGDEWIINFKDEYISQQITIFVDSISTVGINGHDLPLLNVTYDYQYDVGFGYTSFAYHNSTIIKNIGDTEFLLNIISPTEGACDVDYISDLRCYQDPVIGYYSTGIRDSCTYTFDYVWNSISETTERESVVYPNPFDDYIRIYSKGELQFNYKVYDINGRILIHGNNSKINTQHVSSGTYFLQIIFNDTDFEIFKLLKHLP